MNPVNYRSLSVVEKRQVRKNYVVFQQGKCSFCKELLTEKPKQDVINYRIQTKLFPPGFFKWPIHLHHDHKTGLTIGAVHARCNAFLWQVHGE